LFAAKSLKSSTRNFNIANHISFSQAQTRSSVHNKLKHHLHTSNSNRISYFHRLPRLWNALPVFDINLSIATIKARLKAYMWNHFVDNLDDDNPCTYHYLCPCTVANATSVLHQQTFILCKLLAFYSLYKLYICVLGCKHWLLADPWHTCHKAIINK